MDIQIIKIGGGIIDEKEELKDFLRSFAAVQGPKVLVHGGGKGASKQLEQLGIVPKMIEGRRVTDLPTLEVVSGLYAGQYNKEIVSYLNAQGTLAIGLSGADGKLILSKKRAPNPIDYGYVGDPLEDGVNEGLLSLLLGNGYSPVLCAITMDREGQLLNTNADTITSTVAGALAKAGHKVSLTFCFDKLGVLEDVNDPNSLIPEITQDDYHRLLEENIIHDGMKPKLDNAFKVLEKGIEQVRLCHPNHLNGDLGTIIHL